MTAITLSPLRPQFSAAGEDAIRRLFIEGCPSCTVIPEGRPDSDTYCLRKMTDVFHVGNIEHQELFFLHIKGSNDTRHNFTTNAGINIATFFREFLRNDDSMEQSKIIKDKEGEEEVEVEYSFTIRKSSDDKYTIEIERSNLPTICINDNREAIEKFCDSFKSAETILHYIESTRINPPCLKKDEIIRK